MPIRSTRDVSTAQLQRSLQSLEKAVGKATNQDGTLDVQKLEKALQRADSGARLGLETIVDAFQREYTYSTGGGCGSSYQTHTGQRDPTELTAREVSSVLSALVKAKGKAGRFDTHKASGARGKDGVLSSDEAARAVQKLGTALADLLAGAALKGAESDVQAGQAKLGDKLATQLERSAAALRVVGGRDGSVDMTALEASLARLPDGLDGDGLYRVIADHHQRARTVYVSSGCSSRAETRYSDPKKLSADEAGAVNDAFAQAVQLVADAQDARGGLSTSKLCDLMADASAAGDLVGDLMRLFVEPHLPPPPPPPSRSYGGC